MKRILSILTFLFLAISLFTSCTKSKVDPIHSGSRISAVTSGDWKYVSSIDNDSLTGNYSDQFYGISSTKIDYIDGSDTSKYTVTDMNDYNSTITWVYNGETYKWKILYNGKSNDGKDSLSLKEYSTNETIYVEKHLIRK